MEEKKRRFLKFYGCAALSLNMTQGRIWYWYKERQCLNLHSRNYSNWPDRFVCQFQNKYKSFLNCVLEQAKKTMRQIYSISCVVFTWEEPLVPNSDTSNMFLPYIHTYILTLDIISRRPQRELYYSSVTLNWEDCRNLNSNSPHCIFVYNMNEMFICDWYSAAPCLIAYWRHGAWLDAISCPLCRQKVHMTRRKSPFKINMWSKMSLIFQVSVLCHLFSESLSDRQSKEVLGEITAYNKRYSGAPRRVSTQHQPPYQWHSLSNGVKAWGGADLPEGEGNMRWNQGTD